MTAANPLAAARVDSTSGWAGIGLAEDIEVLVSAFDSGSWIDGTIGGFGASMDALAAITDPLGQLVSWGVAWLIEHVKPLSDALDWLAGDPDQINAYAGTWSNVAAAMHNAAADLDAAISADLASWQSPAADAYRQHAGHHRDALIAMGAGAEAMSTVTLGTGLVVALVREIVRDLIADFVSVLSVRLWEWLAITGGTLGTGIPWVAAQVSSLAAKWAAKIARLLTGLINSLRRLAPMLARFDEILQQLGAITARLTRASAAASGQATRWQELTELTRRSHLFHSDADPLARWGPARDTHPVEWDTAIREAAELGVEVTFRPGVMAYGPSPAPGRPGQLVLDPDCSYGALLHELQHLRDDQVVGWAGMRGWFEDPYVRYENEVRAYEQEIQYAESIGDQESIERLRELIREEYLKIFGELP